jgi:hypothetical protein
MACPGNPSLRGSPRSCAAHRISDTSTGEIPFSGLRTGIRQALIGAIPVLREPLIRPHLHVMLVTKRANFLARLRSRHGSSLRTPQQMSFSRRRRAHGARWPHSILNFLCPVRVFIFSYASGVRVSRVNFLTISRWGNFRGGYLYIH